MRITLRRVRQAVTATALAVIATFISPTLASASEPSGTAFGAPCARVQVIAVPGSNETHSGAGMSDPVGAIGGIAERLSGAEAAVRVHYIGYPAVLFGNYWDSKNQGYEATYSTLQYYANQCGNTDFVLVGFSQGAHIAGDLAATIGGGGGPVTADRILSVQLLSDPARNPDFPTVGIDSMPGIPDWRGLSGGRVGFGSLTSRTVEYCTFNDVVCNAAPHSVPAAFADGFSQMPHLQYGQTLVPGTTATYVDTIANAIVQNVINPDGVTY